MNKRKNDRKTVSAIRAKVREAKANEGRPPPLPVSSPSLKIIPLTSVNRKTCSEEFFDDISLFDSAIGVCFIIGGVSFGLALAGLINVR